MNLTIYESKCLPEKKNLQEKRLKGRGSSISIKRQPVFAKIARGSQDRTSPQNQRGEKKKENARNTTNRTINEWPGQEERRFVAKNEKAAAETSLRKESVSPHFSV